MKEFSLTPCLSGQTPVEIVDQPGPDEVAAIGLAYSSEVPYVPFAIIDVRCGAFAAAMTSWRSPSMPMTSTLSLLVPLGSVGAAYAVVAVASGATAAAVAAAAVVASTERRDRDRDT